ncbi:MAG TPA: ABC transporter permease [Anaerolineaceae bacterium]|nr:ABC transporter permease [Anaerolineaceae bacterium]
MRAKIYPSQVVGFAEQNSALVALVIVCLLGALFVSNFASGMNLSAILFQYAIIGFLGLGQLLVILTGGIDLSQGAQVAMISIITAVLMRQAGVLPAVLGSLLVGTVFGLTNGLLVSRTRMPAFVVTLGTMGVARGLAQVISDSKPIAIEVGSFVDFGRSTLAGIPVSAILWVVVSLGLWFFLAQRRTGRHIYAVGGSEESARLSGIAVKNVKLLVFGLSGLLSAVGGIIWTARLSSGSPLGGNGYEMESIAAVIVGGGYMLGGIGTVSGTVVGVLLFGVINSILNLVGISPYWQGTIKGILILAAVALSQFRRIDHGSQARRS